MDLDSVRTLLIDGDGVLWRGDEAIPGLDHFAAVLRRRSIRWALLTNNNTRTVDDYVTKLAGFGLDADPGMVFTSSTATADYLVDRYGVGAPVHALGMSGLIEALGEAGFHLTHGEQAPEHDVVAVAAGMDRDLTYKKVKIAIRLIFAGAEFVATNTDGTYPTPDGLSPGTGMVIGALQGSSGVTPTVIGKPERAIFQAAMKSLGANAATTAMIGDRLETDILGAKRAGIAAIGVLSGVSTREQLAGSAIQPDVLFESIAELAQAFDEATLAVRPG
ncbi:MAG: HAD-IIA family hydrolase [Chloroflexota bacterium]|nr:MAG: HAD-IIA family hydrolase [Chloroflexota bacterium]